MFEADTTDVGITPRKTVLQGLVILAGLWAFYYACTELYPLITLCSVTLILTYVLLPAVDGLEKILLWVSRQYRKIPWVNSVLLQSHPVNPRLLVVLFVYCFFFAISMWVSLRLLPGVTGQLVELGKAMPKYVSKVESYFIDWSAHTIGSQKVRGWFQEDLGQEDQANVNQDDRATPEETPKASKRITPREQQVIRESLFRKTFSHVGQGLSSLGGLTLENWLLFAGRTVQGLIYTLACLLLTFYCLMDGSRLVRMALAALPSGLVRKTVGELIVEFHQVMHSFIKGQVLLGMVTGTYMFIVFNIFHVPFALLLSLIFAIAEILPVIGTYIGITPAIVVCLLGPDPMVTLYMWGCSYCYQTVKDNIVAPKMVGDVMGLHPVVAVIALFVCAKTAGIVGVLVALPFASCLQIGGHYLFRHLAVSAKESLETQKVQSPS